MYEFRSPKLGPPGWNSTTGIAIVTIDRRLPHWYQCYFRESLLHCKAWLHRYCYPWKLSEKTPRKNKKTWQKSRKTFYFVNRRLGLANSSISFITSAVAGYSIRNDSLITLCINCAAFCWSATILLNFLVIRKVKFQNHIFAS